MLGYYSGLIFWLTNITIKNLVLTHGKEIRYLKDVFVGLTYGQIKFDL